MSSLVGRSCFLIVCMLFISVLSTTVSAEVVKYCRFQKGDIVSYGIVEGQRVRELDGDLFGEWSQTDTTYPLKEVKLLVPTRPLHVLAMAGNYKSHIGGNINTTKITTVTTVRTDVETNETTTETSTSKTVQVSGTVPDKFQIPQPFFKSPGCLQAHGGEIVIPKGTETVHYEAEMVIVMGKNATNVSKDEALDYVLGVTCGNDVSARDWQSGDVQWWRAKGSDTFGPCGPYIVSGIDYDNLMMTLRLNGEERQRERTSQLIHDVSSTVSFISQHLSLLAGDLIFTGTPGSTDTIKPGDVVEVELERVGVLRNTVVAE